MASLSNYNIISIDPSSNIYNYIGNNHIFKNINTSTLISSSVSLSNLLFNPQYSSYNVYMIINNVGNVGIGTTIPKYKLDVNGTAYFNNLIAKGDGITNINASNLVSGTLSSSVLPTIPFFNSNKSYTDTTNIYSLTVDTYGRITSVQNSEIQLSYINVTGLVSSATIDTTNASNITSGILSTSQIPGSQISATYLGNANNVYNLNASNILLGVLPISLYPKPSTLVSGIYGNAQNCASITVDQYGRITSVTNIPYVASTDITNASNISIGRLNTSRYPTSGMPTLLVNYGSITNNLSITIDTYGRVTAITNVTSYTTQQVPYTYVQGLSSSATIDTTNITNISGYYNKTVIPSIINASYLIGDGFGLGIINISNCYSTIPSNCLQQTGVIAGSYGSAVNNFICTVDTYGRITTITNINVPNNLYFSLLNASNIISGTIPIVNLPKSTVSPNYYGSSTNSFGFTVDQYGRIMSSINSVIQLSYTDIQGLSSTATTNIDSLSIYSDLATSDISINNSISNINIYGNNIILNTSTTNITNYINGNLYQMPLYLSSLQKLSTNTQISIPTNFNLTNYRSIDIRLYIYTSNITNISLSAIDTNNNIITPSEPHSFFQYGTSIGSGSTISTTNVIDTTPNVIINTVSNNSIYLNMNISKADTNSSNFYLIDSHYYNSNLNRILHGYSSGIFVSSGLINNCLFNIQNGPVNYRWSTINYY